MESVLLLLDPLNKIVQRFYETPEGLSSGSNKRKVKIPIPAAPKTGFPFHPNKQRDEFKFKITGSVRAERQILEKKINNAKRLCRPHQSGKGHLPQVRIRKKHQCFQIQEHP